MAVWEGTGILVKLFSWGKYATVAGSDDGVGAERRHEERLLALARRGDRGAFDALAAPHRDSLRKFLARRVAVDALDDVAQEALLAAWLALPEFESRARFRTWLYQIALHKAADWGRINARRSNQEAAAPPEEAMPTEEPGYRAAEHRATALAVLESVPPIQREVIELYYFAEMTLPEIATLLGRNLNTVKYQFYRAHAVAAEALRQGEEMAFGAASAAAPGTVIPSSVLMSTTGAACEV